MACDKIALKIERKDNATLPIPITPVFYQN